MFRQCVNALNLRLQILQSFRVTSQTSLDDIFGEPKASDNVIFRVIQQKFGYDEAAREVAGRALTHRVVHEVVVRTREFQFAESEGCFPLIVGV